MPTNGPPQIIPQPGQDGDPMSLTAPLLAPTPPPTANALKAPDPQSNTYGPQAFNGTFADAIQPKLLSEPHRSDTKFSGYGGKGEAILGIMDKFLAGYGQARAQRAMATETQKAEQVQGYTNWAKLVMSNPDVPPEMKSQFEQEFAHAQMMEAAKATQEVGKKNPILGALNKVFSGMAGGDVTKSKKDVNALSDVVAKWTGLIHSPQGSIRGQKEIVFNQAQGLIEQARKANGGKLTSEQAQAALTPALGSIEKLWGAQQAKEVVATMTSGFDKEGAKPQSAEEQRAALEKKLADERAAKPATQGAPPGAQAKPAGTPPGAQSQAAPGQAGAPAATPSSDKKAETQPKIVVLPPYTETESAIINHQKLAEKPTQVVLEGEKKPVWAEQIKPYVTDNGLGIKGGWRLSDGRIVSMDSASPFKDKEETAKAREDEGKRQRYFNFKHGRPLDAPLGPEDEPKSIAEWNEAVETPDKKKQAELDLRRKERELDKQLSDAGKDKNAAKGAQARFDSKKSTVQNRFNSAASKARDEYLKAVQNDPTRSSPTSVQAYKDYMQKMQDSYDAWRQSLQEAQTNYESDGKLGDHNPWADNLPENYEDYVKQTAAQKSAKPGASTANPGAPPATPSQNASAARQPNPDQNVKPTTATMDNVEAYAKRYNVTRDQALAQFKKEGIAVK